ncbi:hypothetical protein B0O99DRAFT_695980 [Bisporella sp. PMI_857]|nr:hypothetical protein B0O99DRAFT_695980 [Bisporella sp. PMI_857]
MPPPSDLSDSWIKCQKQNNKTVQTWACIWCSDRKTFQTTDELHKHANVDHPERFPQGISDYELCSLKANELEPRQKKTETDTMLLANILGRLPDEAHTRAHTEHTTSLRRVAVLEYRITRREQG